MPQDPRLPHLSALERRVLWLATWTVHHANHLRPNPDGVKVGGHQASSASLVTILTALYLAVLRPEDRVAVKPHAAPAFHALMYLLGRQTRDKLERFRGLGGAQSYPSRTKDTADVDFSTGSVGLGVAQTLFSSLTQDYLRLKGMGRGPEGRMVALLGDAEMDEGNVAEALMEGWKHGVRNLWWVVDYNRQSLDAVVRDGLWARHEATFRNFGWDVVVLRHGGLQRAAFAEPGGERLREWIEACPNPLYAALSYQGGAAWRRRLTDELGDQGPLSALLARRTDDDLAALMGNLGGHDLPSLLEAFEAARAHDRPTCFIAYTIKGQGLPLAGHKDNHAGLLTPDQMDAFRAAMGVREGREWEPFEGMEDAEGARRLLAAAPFAARARHRRRAPAVPVPADFPRPSAPVMSTQQGFGLILNELARRDDDLARRLVTASPDVTVSTNLGPWVNRRRVFAREEMADTFRRERIASTFEWRASPMGQHVELGIAEMNLFLLLSALGLAHELHGERLLPVGTLYDPFVARGLDALNHALYQDARFLLVATPSGVTLAPEGGAHQSVNTPLIGLSQPGLSAWEPAYVDELSVLMRHALERMQAPDGGASYLRLTTRPLEQPRREMTEALARDVVEGGYWWRPPGPNAEVVVACLGAVTPEAVEAVGLLAEDRRDAGLLAVTSPGRLHAGWTAAQRAREAGERGATCHAERLLSAVPSGAALVTVLDGHPAALSWLGAVRGHRVRPLGVEAFGQTGTVADLYRVMGLDAAAIAAAAEAIAPGRPLRHLRRAG